MSQISPPIRIVFIAVVGLCAAYMLFFRPKPADTAAPTAAPAAATTPVPGEDPVAVRGSKAAAILEKAAGDKQAAGAHNTKPVSQAPATGRSQLAALPADVRRAVAHRKVIALLFYNNRSDDDKATRRALSHVDRFGGQVFIDAHWIKNVAPYEAITRGVDLRQSPTVVVVDRNLKAQTLVGFVDAEAIEQAVVDALLASGGSTVKKPYFRQLDAVCSSAHQQDKALSQPSSAAAVPAYLVGLQAISVDADAKAAAVKAPRKYAAFGRAFNRFNASTTGVLAAAAKDAKPNPAKSVSIARATQRREKAMGKQFVAKHGSHGLSCF